MLWVKFSFALKICSNNCLCFSLRQEVKQNHTKYLSLIFQKCIVLLQLNCSSTKLWLSSVSLHNWFLYLYSVKCTLTSLNIIVIKNRLKQSPLLTLPLNSIPRKIKSTPFIAI